MWSLLAYSYLQVEAWNIWAGHVAWRLHWRGITEKTFFLLYRQTLKCKDLEIFPSRSHSVSQDTNFLLSCLSSTYYIDLLNLLVFNPVIYLCPLLYTWYPWVQSFPVNFSKEEPQFYEREMGGQWEEYHMTMLWERGQGPKNSLFLMSLFPLLKFNFISTYSNKHVNKNLIKILNETIYNRIKKNQISRRTSNEIWTKLLYGKTQRENEP